MAKTKLCQMAFGRNPQAELLGSFLASIITLILLSLLGEYLWNNVLYNQSGLYYDTLQSIFGCDSILMLNLTINQSAIYFDSVSVCNSYFWNGNTYNQSGNYTDTLQGVLGCDSIIVLDLNINSSSTSPIELELILDNWCLETSWKIVDEFGITWYDEGPYDCSPSGGGYQANDTIIQNLMLKLMV